MIPIKVVNIIPLPKDSQFHFTNINLDNKRLGTRDTI